MMGLLESRGSSGTNGKYTNGKWSRGPRSFLRVYKGSICAQLVDIIFIIIGGQKRLSCLDIIFMNTHNTLG